MALVGMTAFMVKQKKDQESKAIEELAEVELRAKEKDDALKRML